MTPGTRRSWLVSVVGTAALVAVVVALADVSALPVLVGRLEWPLALTALVLLQCEGLASALRLRLLVAGGTLRDSLAVTAWWVAGLAVLPARLGEITGMHALTRRCGVDAGVAVNSLLLQRLFDAAWLLVIGALALALHDGAGGGGVINVAAVLLAAALLIVACIGRMSLLFGIVAARLRRWRRTRFARGALRMALAGRRAARAVTRPGTLLRLGVLSLTKWLFNLAAIGTVLLAQLPAVPLPAALVVAAVFNLATVVPVQTIGGIGLGELGFAAALGFYGYDLATAAAAALVLRAVLLAAPLVFFVLVVVPERMLPPTRAELA